MRPSAIHTYENFQKMCNIFYLADNSKVSTFFFFFFFGGGTLGITYKTALEKCTLVTLKDRRKKICTDFGSLERDPQCQDWLSLTQSTHYSLRKRAKYQQFQCKTKRFQNNALPYLIRL